MRLFSLSLSHTHSSLRPTTTMCSHACAFHCRWNDHNTTTISAAFEPRNDFETIPTSRVQNRITVCPRRVENIILKFILSFFSQPTTARKTSISIYRLCMCVRTRNTCHIRGGLTVRVLFNASAPRRSQYVKNKKKNSTLISNFKLQKLFLKTTSNDGGVRKYLYNSYNFCNTNLILLFENFYRVFVTRTNKSQK